MMLAYLLTNDGKAVGLVSDGPRLRWESETRGLAEEAESFVPVASIPVSAGNQAAWAVRRLAEFIPGRTAVLASNVPPADCMAGVKF